MSNDESVLVVTEVLSLGNYDEMVSALLHGYHLHTQDGSVINSKAGLDKYLKIRSGTDEKFCKVCKHSESVHKDYHNDKSYCHADECDCDGFVE